MTERPYSYPRYYPPDNQKMDETYGKYYFKTSQTELLYVGSPTRQKKSAKKIKPVASALSPE